MVKHGSANQAQKDSRKTTITLALNSEILAIMRGEAELEGSSLNSRINAVLEKYATFYKYMEMLESCIIPYNQFAKMLELMDEKALTEIITNDGNAHAMSALKQNKLPITLTTVIENIFKTGARYSGAYKSFHHYADTEGYECLVFDHKYGMKWSRIIATGFSRLIEMAVDARVKSEILPYTVTLRVMVRDNQR
jgi:hypothetical protein